MEIVSSNQKTCEYCAGTYPIFEGEIEWCNHCEWHIQGDINKDLQLTSFQKIYCRIGKKIAENLYNTLIETNTERPRLSTEKILAYAFATSIHLSTLLIFAAGFVSFIFLPTWAAILSAIICTTITWNVIPKRREWPQNIVTRESFPTFYGISEQIAKEMKTTPPHSIEVLTDFNATYTQFGFGGFKKKVIGLGIPLMNQLSDEEIVAIISHETSHGANDDIARGLYINSAIRALANWYYMLSPQHLNEGAIRGQSNMLATWFANLIGWSIALIPLAEYHLLTRLLLRQTQEAEYLADRLAAEVCGTTAMMKALSNLANYSTFENAVQKAALSKNDVNVFDLIRDGKPKTKSEHERERRNRLEIRAGLSFDTTHPPTPYRINFLKRTDFIPKVVLTLEQSRKLREEIESLKPKISHKLKDNYLNSLYYGSGA